jgi:diguanylate cyclase (GGDEF)-like protein
MTTERILFINVLVLSAIILLFLSIIIWRRRTSIGPSAIYLSICLAAICVYNFGYAMEISNDTLEGIMLWVRFQHWGIQLITPTWLLFTLYMVGKEKWINPMRVAALIIIPAVVLVASQTLGGLNLAHPNPHLNTSGPFPTFTYDRGLFMYLALGFMTLCLASTLVLFIIMLLHSAPAFREQAALWVIACLFPFITEVLYNAGLTPYNLDITPFALTLSGIILAWGLFKYRLLDIVPLARDVIFDNLNDGVMVLDNQDRIIDINSSLQVMFTSVSKKSIGRSIYDILTDYSTFLEFIKKNSPGKVEFEVQKAQGTFSCLGTLSPLYSAKKKRVGKIITLHDNTQARQLLEQLEELAARDSLTGVYNRRSFDQLATQKMYHLQHSGGMVSLIMLDLDFFKRVNDNYSHAAGDAALIAVTATCRTLLRQTDILSRFGGEEFIILLPDTDSMAAHRIAERLREGIEQQCLSYEGHSIHVTASLGVTSVVSSSAVTLEELILCADRAVYQAKQAGRNRVVVCDPS